MNSIRFSKILWAYHTVLHLEAFAPWALAEREVRVSISHQSRPCPESSGWKTTFLCFSQWVGSWARARGTPEILPILVIFLPMDPTAGQRGKWKLPSVGGLLTFALHVRTRWRLSTTPLPSFPNPVLGWKSQESRAGGRGCELIWGAWGRSTPRKVGGRELTCNIYRELLSSNILCRLCYSPKCHHNPQKVRPF